MADIQALSVDFQRDAVSKPAFYRALMNHTWWLAGQREAHGALRLGLLRPEGGGRIIELFSDDDAIQGFEAQTGEPWTPHRLHLAGFEIFGALREDFVDRLNVDPLSPHTFHFLHTQVPMLRQWARIVQLETALNEPGRIGDPIGVMAGFDDYHVVVVPKGHGQGHDFVLAPDHVGRSLAAIFTSEDAAQSFADAVKDELDRPPVVQPRGAVELFTQLKAMTLQGLVFNPWTDLPARALSAQIIDPILKLATDKA